MYLHHLKHNRGFTEEKSSKCKTKDFNKTLDSHDTQSKSEKGQTTTDFT